MTNRDIQDRMLSALHPAHGEPPPLRWQQRKSAQTRQRLVDAGVDCLIERGYVGLTTAAVAERCAVSRGAMHHHFPTRLELVGAVVEYVFYQRMRRFLDDYFAALAQRGEELLVEVACEAHWQSVQTREYAAFLELALAARTDGELAGLFTPASRRYDQIWIAEMIEAFPQWEAHWDNLKLANDVTTALHMGMVLHRPVFGDGERAQRLQRLATRVVQSLYEAP
jgi:AcrR family transcriptional regulator